MEEVKVNWYGLERMIRDEEGVERSITIYFKTPELREVYVKQNNLALQMDDTVIRVGMFKKFKARKFNQKMIQETIEKRNVQNGNIEWVKFIDKLDKRVWTEEEIKSLLTRNNLMVVRSLLQLFNKQTEWEKKVRETKDSNKVGFNSSDASVLTGISKYLIKKKTLSDKQLDLVRSKILKYSKQLTMIANGVL